MTPSRYCDANSFQYSAETSENIGEIHSYRSASNRKDDSIVRHISFNYFRWSARFFVTSSFLFRNFPAQLRDRRVNQRAMNTSVNKSVVVDNSSPLFSKFIIKALPKIPCSDKLSKRTLWCASLTCFDGTTCHARPNIAIFSQFFKCILSI